MRASTPARLLSLDAVRGVAVLGILVVNIQSFAFVGAARTNPTVQGNFDGVNWWVWVVTHVLFDGKFISMFAILFGASIVLLADRCSRRGVSAGRIHYRRMLILLGFGVIHAHLLWYGDWLFTLAVAGAVAFLYHDLPPRRLFAAGVAVYAVGWVIWLVIAWWLPRWSAEVAADLSAQWSPSAQAIAWEVDRYRSGWLQQMWHRMPAALRYQTSSLATRGLWQMTGLMLVGMALLKLEILTAARATRFYAAMAAAGFGVGALLVVFGVGRSIADGWSLHGYVVFDSQLNYWGGAVMSLGWIATVMLLVRAGWNLSPLAAVGRLALTNYLLQTVICTTIFYGHGLGRFARMERIEQVGIVAAIWVFQVAISVVWIRYFTFGPVEWLWRCLTYGRWFPIRRHALEAVQGVGDL